MLGAGPDNDIYVWSFAWWPHAILSWTNPVVTHAILAPSGVDLAWTTTVPGLALVFAPLTLLFGPVASFNCATILLPAVAGWAAYRFCFVLTGSLWASVVGGYLYGFSSFILAQQIAAHVYLTADFVLPLIALQIVRFVRGELTRRSFVVRFGALIAIQLSIATEVLFTLTTMLVILLALAVALVPGARPRLRVLVPSIVAGYCVGAVLTAPLVVYALLKFPTHGFVHDPAYTDLLNLFFPTQVNAIAGDSFNSIRVYFDPEESAIFLGAPALLITVLYVWRTRASGWSGLLVISLATAILFALGPKLVVAGHAIAPLPWRLVDDAPGFTDVHTPRFGEYASLASAVIVALWTAGTAGRVFRRPYVLPFLAVAALVPAVWKTTPTVHPERPAFFATGLYKSCIPPHETLAIFPFGGEEDLIQAETGFSFAVAGGYLNFYFIHHDPIVSFNNDPTVAELHFYGDRGLPTVNALLAFATRNKVDRFVSFVGDGYPTARQMRAFGPVQQIGGVYVAPACGQPSLRTHPLSKATKLVLSEQKRGVTIQYCLGGYTYNLPAGLAPAALLKGATTAFFVSGHGLTCSLPAGSNPHGFAGQQLGVPPDTYRYYTT